MASAPARPDAALYKEAQTAEAALRASPRRAAKRSEWEAVVLRYRKIVARYPRSGYCDNALLAAGNLYREMAQRFRSPRYREDAVGTYRMLVAEYPSSRLGDDALWAAVEVAREAADRRRLADSARAYLDTYPEGQRASQVKKLLREREPATPLPSPPPPGLARVFDLRAWSGDSSTRVVIDVERKVSLQYDRATNPDRLWVDLVGTRLHPNLARRVFPVGDGLLEQVRIAQNKDDVVRVVLDFKDVWEHQVFFLDNPTRLVIDVRGQASPSPQVAQGSPAIPTRRVNGMVPSDVTADSRGTPTAPIAIAGVDHLPGSRPAPLPKSGRGAPPPPVGRRRADPRPRAPGHEPSRLLQPRPPARPRRPAHRDRPRPRRPRPRHERPAKGCRRRTSSSTSRCAWTVWCGRSLALRSSSPARPTSILPLEERTAIANSRGADLFLSIHANAARNPRARGIETYFLNFAQNPHAEAVAARENAISPATLKDLQNLVKAITLNSKIDESRDFAAAVQEHMVAGVRQEHPVPDRGVHTAPFYVLIGANMPAVLAEIGFVSNPDDERRLKTPEYREVLARSLLRGVKSYLEALNRTQMRQLTDAARRSTVEGGRGGR